MPDFIAYAHPARARQLYATLAPFAEALLRVVVGLWLVPHGLRMAFGFFPTTGFRIATCTCWRPISTNGAIAPAGFGRL